MISEALLRRSLRKGRGTAVASREAESVLETETGGGYHQRPAPARATLTGEKPELSSPSEPISAPAPPVGGTEQPAAAGRMGLGLWMLSLQGQLLVDSCEGQWWATPMKMTKIGGK